MEREANENIELLFKMHEDEENEGWFYTNLKELSEKYGGKFFAIKDKNILIATDAIDEIPSFLEKKASTLIRSLSPLSRRRAWLHSVRGEYIRIPLKIRFGQPQPFVSIIINAPEYHIQPVPILFLVDTGNPWTALTPYDA